MNDRDKRVVESMFQSGMDKETVISLFPQFAREDVEEIGKKLGTGDAELFARTLDLTKMMDKYGLKVDKIFFHDQDEVTLYFGKVRVSLGNDRTHIEDKIMNLPVFMETLEGKSGVLDMKEYDETNGIYIFKADTE